MTESSVPLLIFGSILITSFGILVNAESPPSNYHFNNENSLFFDGEPNDRHHHVIQVHAEHDHSPVETDDFGHTELHPGNPYKGHSHPMSGSYSPPPGNPNPSYGPPDPVDTKPAHPQQPPPRRPGPGPLPSKKSQAQSPFAGFRSPLQALRDTIWPSGGKQTRPRISPAYGPPPQPQPTYGSPQHNPPRPGWVNGVPGLPPPPPTPTYSAPPQQGYTLPPQPTYTAPPESTFSPPPQPQPTYGAPPQPTNTAPPQPTNTAPPQPTNTAPPQQGYGAPPQPIWSSTPPQPSWSSTPPQSSWSSTPPQSSWSSTPPQSSWSSTPPQQGYNGPQPTQPIPRPKPTFGTPPPSPQPTYGVPPRPNPTYGVPPAPPQSSYGPPTPPQPTYRTPQGPPRPSPTELNLNGWQPGPGSFGETPTTQGTRPATSGVAPQANPTWPVVTGHGGWSNDGNNPPPQNPTSSLPLEMSPPQPSTVGMYFDPSPQSLPPNQNEHIANPQQQERLNFPVEKGFTFSFRKPHPKGPPHTKITLNYKGYMAPPTATAATKEGYGYTENSYDGTGLATFEFDRQNFVNQMFPQQGQHPEGGYPNARKRREEKRISRTFRF